MPRLRFLIAFLAVTFLSGAADKLTPDRYTLDQRVAKITWKAACRISQYEECPKRGPAVRRSPVIGEVGARGAYWMGTPVVWLDKALSTGTQMWLTIFHEQIHYLQGWNRVDSLGFDKTLRCLIEREALDFTNAYADELGRPDLKRTLKVWRKLYGCDLSSKNVGMSH